METDLRELQLRGYEEIDELPGQLLYALEGNLDGEGLYRLSYGMIGPDTLEISLYIAPETFELYRLNIVHHRPEAEEDTLWQIDFWEVDQPESGRMTAYSETNDRHDVDLPADFYRCFGSHRDIGCIATSDLRSRDTISNRT